MTKKSLLRSLGVMGAIWSFVFLNARASDKDHMPAVRNEKMIIGVHLNPEWPKNFSVDLEQRLWKGHCDLRDTPIYLKRNITESQEVEVDRVHSCKYLRVVVNYLGMPTGAACFPMKPSMHGMECKISMHGMDRESLKINCEKSTPIVR